jgi:hypothetical protein
MGVDHIDGPGAVDRRDRLPQRRRHPTSVETHAQLGRHQVARMMHGISAFVLEGRHARHDVVRGGDPEGQAGEVRDGRHHRPGMPVTPREVFHPVADEHPVDRLQAVGEEGRQGEDMHQARAGSPRRR